MPGGVAFDSKRLRVNSQPVAAINGLTGDRFMGFPQAIIADCQARPVHHCVHHGLARHDHSCPGVKANLSGAIPNLLIFYGPMIGRAALSFILSI
jgi:hypothetical protein